MRLCDSQTMQLNSDIKWIFLFCLTIYFVLSNKLAAQPTYQLPPNQPEQDACNALQLCSSSFSTPYSYTGAGRQVDLDQTPCYNQPGSGERNSVWLRVHVAAAGNIVFRIKPVDPQDDYDFAVLNITGKSCSALSPNDVVRCNFNNNLPGSNIAGMIGLSDTSLTPYIQAGTFGGSFCEAVHTKSDEEYLIMINNYGNYVSGGPSKGFSIDFTGSTSVFYNPVSPQLSAVDVPCNNAKSIVVKTNTEILCNSIAADGSDFTTNAPAQITGASGINCTDRGGYTNSIIINFSSVLPPGNYTINVKKGSDNNTLAGLCNNELLPSAAVPFIVKLNGKATINNQFICYEQLPYTWNGIQVTNAGDSVATYTTTSAAGCDSIAILNLHVSQPPQQANTSKTICDGDFYVLPWDTTVTTGGTYIHHYTNTNGCDSLVQSITIHIFIPAGGTVKARDSIIQTGFCQDDSVALRPESGFISYLWNTGETSNSIIVNVAGAYSVVAKDKDGCNTIDTFVVARYPYPTPGFHRFENLCNGGTITLDAGPISSYYLWNNGSNTETITTNKPGQFWVTSTTAHNCRATDTVNVVTVQRPGDFLIPSVSKCPYNTVTLTPSNNFNLYRWSNGSNTKSIDVSAKGFYWLDVTDRNGCTGRDSITVVDSTCPEYFFMPSAFTPNSDNHNDKFRPRFSGPLSGYHLAIYNRWGKLIFSTNDSSAGWDGTVEGHQQALGVYVWLCSYTLDGKSHNEKGTVVLVR